jgi:hypothetical protein
MARALVKYGLWTSAICVVAFVAAAGGICGPSSDLGTYVAEAAMFGVPLGLVASIAGGVMKAIQR